MIANVSYPKIKVSLLVLDGMRVKVKVDKVGEAEAVLDAGRNPKTVREIVKRLPIEAEALRWGDEIYFYVDFRLPEENTQTEVEIGDIAYWSEGPGIGIFLGKTPISTGDKPKAAGKVNVIGRITGNLEKLKKTPEGAKIRIQT